MKKQITGYITGVINSYTRTIERLKANGAPITSTNTFKAFTEEFTDLLEYVIDIPEESKEISILSFNLSLENENLKQANAKLLNRIVELEEFCENLNEVEGNLHRKIEELEKEKNQAIENVMSSREVRNADYAAFQMLRKEIKQLKAVLGRKAK